MPTTAGAVPSNRVISSRGKNIVTPWLKIGAAVKSLFLKIAISFKNKLLMK
jgi:hypothetical protein